MTLSTNTNSDDEDECSSIFINNIPRWTSKLIIQQGFGSFGEIKSIELIRDDKLYFISQAKITFTSLEIAKNAIAEMNGKLLDGCKLSVTFA